MAKLWSPEFIETDLWLDASDIATITLDTGVSEWGDKSGNGRHISQSTPANQPIFDGQSVSFDSSTYLSNTSPFMWDGGACTVLAVLDTNPASDARWISEGSSTDTDPIYSPAQVAVTPITSGASLIRSTTGVNIVASSSNLYPNMFPGKSIIGFSDTGSSITLFKDGIDGSPLAYTRSSPLALNTFCVGGLLRSTFASGFNGKVHEILVLPNNPTTPEKQKIEGYLAWKWGLQGNLPVDHPYYDAAPVLFTPADVPVANKLKLTLDSSAISTDQTDFPLTVHLDSTNPLHESFFDEAKIISDTFEGTDGDAPNADMWEVYHDSQDGGSTAGTALIKNNALEFTNPAATTTPAIRSNFTLGGDFDIQADFNIPASIEGLSNWAFGLHVSDVNNDLFDAKTAFSGRYYLANGPYRMGTYNVGSVKGGSADQSGQFRIVRVGSTVDVYYWTGSDWSSLVASDTSYGTHDVYVTIFNRTWSAVTTKVQFDNFRINSVDTIVGSLNFKKFSIESDGVQCQVEIESWRQIAGEPIFVGGTASASSVFSADYNADKLFDGDDTTRWNCEEGGTVPQWVQYDLGGAVTKRAKKASIKAFMENVTDGRFKDFIIQGSSDGINWDDLYTGIHPNGTEDYQDYDLDVTGDYRYYRLYIVSMYDTDLDALPSVYEFKLFGVNSEVVLHTKVPTYLAAEDTELVLSFDSTQPDNEQYVGLTGEVAAQAVWDSNFVAVYHMAQDPSQSGACILDSTVNALHGEPTAGMISSDLVDGYYGGTAIHFNGTERVLVPDNDLLTPASLTLEALIQADANWAPSQLDYHTVVSKGSIYDGNSTYTLRFYENSNDVLTYFEFSNSAGNCSKNTVDNDYAVTVPGYVVGVSESGVGCYGYLDGAPITCGYTSVPTDTVNTAYAFAIGGVYSVQNANDLNFFGNVGEIRLSSSVRSDDWIKLTGLSLTGQAITWSTYSDTGGPLTKALAQLYSLFGDDLFVVLEQKYGLMDIRITPLVQYYSLRTLLEFVQYYGTTPEFYARLQQWYWDAEEIIRGLEQKYSDTAELVAKLEQLYSGPNLLIKALRQLYTLTNDPLFLRLIQSYDLDEKYKFAAKFVQAYTIVEAGGFRKLTSSVLINGAIVKASAINIEYSKSSYCGSITVQLIDFTEWEKVNYQDTVTITVGSEQYIGVVTDINKSETSKRTAFTIVAKSKAVLLDFPFATEIDDDSYVYGNASDIVNRIAADYSQAVVWEMVSDPPQNENTYNISGNSPLQAIRGLVNAVGGILQSDPDGTLRAVPRYRVNSDKIEDATPDYVYSASTDFVSINTDHDKRDGYNKYTINSDEDESGFTLEAEEVSAGYKRIKAYKSPWSTQSVTLRTSELTNVTIFSQGIYIETIENELVEIKKGTGKTTKPIYNITNFDYNSRIDLGNITYTDEGIITSQVKETSLVTITYTTRYWLWDVYDTDQEKVQFILESN